MANKKKGGQAKETQPRPARRFDALWWVVIYGPIVWWGAMLVLVLLQRIGWNIFISTGFIVMGCFYGIQAVLRMLIKPLGKGYSKGHHIAFLIAGLFWAILGIILIFVTKGL
jgi:hypothetical protein